MNGAVFAVRAVEDGEDHVEPETGERRGGFRFVGARRSAINEHDRLFGGTRRQEHFATAAHARDVTPRLLDHLRRRRGGGRTIGEYPAAVLLDAKSDRLVALSIEIGEDSRRGCQRDFMLARASAVEHTNAKTFHGKYRGEGSL